jgi:hypothetical protein
MSHKGNDEVVDMVLDYMAEHNCSLEEALSDLEFDGPNGSYGPTPELITELRNSIPELVVAHGG